MLNRSWWPNLTTSLLVTFESATNKWLTSGRWDSLFVSGPKLALGSQMNDIKTRRLGSYVCLLRGTGIIETLKTNFLTSMMVQLAWSFTYMKLSAGYWDELLQKGRVKKTFKLFIWEFYYEKLSKFYQPFFYCFFFQPIPNRLIVILTIMIVGEDYVRSIIFFWKHSAILFCFL